MLSIDNPFADRELLIAIILTISSPNLRYESGQIFCLILSMDHRTILDREIGVQDADHNAVFHALDSSQFLSQNWEALFLAFETCTFL